MYGLSLFRVTSCRGGCCVEMGGICSVVRRKTVGTHDGMEQRTTRDGADTKKRSDVM